MLLLFEGHSGSDNNTDLEMIEEWRIKEIFPEYSIYFFSGNLVADEIAISKGVKINVIPIDQEQWEVVPEVITSRDLVQDEGIMLEIDKQSILTAYPLNLIE